MLSLQILPLVVPKMMPANFSRSHFISARLLARSVVEESQMTAPMKMLGMRSQWST